MKRRLRLFAILMPSVLLAASALFLPTSAGASVGSYTPYPYGVWGDPTGFGGQYIRLAWNGAYPSGYARVESNSTAYSSIQLQTCTGSSTSVCSGWIAVATQNLAPHGYNQTGVTPSVRIGKYSWYRACAKTNNGGNWLCWAGTTYAWPIYLGD
jgi:hypothetical protein